MILDIKNYFEAQLEAFPEVTHFVCGCDEQALREAVTKFSSYYMFVDFGSFESLVDGNNRINDTFEVGVTIAMPIGVRLVNMDDILEYQQFCFDIVAKLRKQMLDEQREVPFISYLSAKHQILPFAAPDIARSVGSTLAFRIEGKDILGVKYKERL